jgi:5'-nucleotidase
MGVGAGRRRIVSRAVVGTAVTALAVTAASGFAPARAAAPSSGSVELQILSFNDFHGQLMPPAGSDGRLTTSTGTIDAGGAEYLATHLRSLRAHHRNSLTVTAGDLIGGSPPLSGLFKDEPSIETMNALKVDASAVGNHELDEGVSELLRVQYGGCHQVEGCFDKDGYSGAAFPYLVANAVYKRQVAVKAPPRARAYGSWFRSGTGRTVLPPTMVRQVGGVKVGLIGITTDEATELVAPSGIKDITFSDEVAAANLAAKDLRRQGVAAMVLLLHEGGTAPSGTPFDADCNPKGGAATITGPVVPIAQRLDPGIDLVITGHTHQPYACSIPDPAGRPRQVTSAASHGRIITETTLTLDRRTKDVVRSSVKSVNHPVTRTVAAAADQSAIVKKWTGLATPVTSRVIGKITADITRSASRDTESGLGDLIADAQLEATSGTDSGKAVIALMNPGGVRADLLFAASADGGGDGEVTYGEAFTVQPFGNSLMSMTLTGTQLEKVLEQQWTAQADGSVRFLHLGVSKGLTYSWSAAGAVGDRIDPSTIKLDGTAVDPAGSYRVTVNSFLADGGDGFTELTKGTNRLGGGTDLDAFTAYVTAHSPVTGPGADRVTRVP